MSNSTPQPTLSQLRAFVAVATHGHFGTAAARAGLSQSTLSQSLASLEATLGVTLLERNTRRVLVTDRGRELLDRAAAIVEMVDAFTAHAAGTVGIAGPLRLGVIPTVAPYLLPGLLPGLREAMPAVTLHVVEDQTARLVDALSAGALDAAVVALPSESPRLDEIPLYEEDFVLVTPADHPLAGRSDLTLADLDAEPLLLLDEGHCLRDQTLDLCRSHGVHPMAGETRATSLTTVVHLVAAGMGVTLVPGSAVDRETARDDLTITPFAHEAVGRRIGLVYRSSTARGDQFADLARVIRDAAPAGAHALPQHES